ncbi:MAG: TonB-dependent receptor [Sphingomonadales bacterium]|nr:MAG: TonB-dependent receptor [Sphingomonadales bacterium]
MIKIRGIALSATASVLAIVSSGAAHAQASGDGAPTTALPAAPSAQDKPEPALDDGDIVVTAQRREERLKDVPITVNLISGEDIASSGASSSRDIQTLVPGITTANNAYATQFTIRGVGSTVVSGEAPVSIYIDGVYLASQSFSVFDLMNIDSIQVLKGPQGTLFGRNATGGAILVTTADPGKTLSGKISAGYGRFDDVRLAASISGPLSDNVGFDLTARYHDDNGYTRDVSGERMSDYREYGVRGKLVFEPGVDTKVRVIGDWGKLYDAAGASFVPVPGQKVATAGAFVPTTPYEVSFTFSPYARSEGGGGSVDVQHDFGGVSLKSISAYRVSKMLSMSDSDRVKNAVQSIRSTVNEDTITQEFTLASTQPGPVQWIVGAYYFNLKRFAGQQINNATTIEADADNESYSGFGELTTQVSGSLKLIAGLRFTRDSTRIHQERPTGTPRTFDNSISFDAWTPRVSAVYALNDDSNVYATYSKGFKSGLFNATSFAGAPIKPENLSAYEVGFKHAQRGLNFNVSAYYYDFKDLQLSARLPNGSSFTLNASNAEIYGLDADLAVVLGGGFRLRAGGNFTHARYKDFVQAPFFEPLPAGGNRSFTADASGKKLVRAPDFSGTLGLDYRREYTSGTLTGGANLYYNSGFSWSVDNRYNEDPYALLSGTVGWSWNDDRYRVSLWGKNLTNTLYAQGGTVTTAADAFSYARPRSYGVAFDLGF